MQATANVNGNITPLKDAKISILDRGFLFGDSIYEVIRTYDGFPFYLEEHLDRLENSARLARIKISQSRDFLREQIKQTALAAHPKQDVFIRFAITRGAGVLDLDPTISMESGFVIFVKEIPPWNPEFYKTGMKLAVPRLRRNSPLCLDPNIKSGNYLNNILAVGQARDLGADDAMILSLDGNLTEACNSNVVFILNDKIITAAHEENTSTGNLRGLTKRLLSQIASEMGIKYEERTLKPIDIEKATECFVTSATREIMPVKEILWENGKTQTFSGGTGQWTLKLSTAYKSYIKNYVNNHQSGKWFSI